MSVAEISTWVARQAGRRDAIVARIEKLEDARLEASRNVKAAEQARAVIQEVARRTQQQLQYHISEVATLAMQAIFPQPYNLIVEFVERRGRTEADIWFERDGQQIDPLSASGGGAVDVAAFALRVSLLSLSGKARAAIIVLDEPFRFLSRDLHSKAALLMKEVSRRLGLQVVMVSHSPDLVDGADAVFSVRQMRKQSIVSRELTA